MSLSSKQQRFTQCIGMLIMFATHRGYALTMGDAYRDSRAFGSFGKKKLYAAAHSVHKKRLACDFNLFVNGEYIQDGNHDAWEILGSFWETLDISARWGGRFQDYGHFSFEYNGYK